MSETTDNAAMQAVNGNFVSAALGIASEFVSSVGSLFGGASQADKDRAKIQSEFLNNTWPKIASARDTMQWSKTIRPSGKDIVNPDIINSKEYADYMHYLNLLQNSRTEIGKDASQSHTVAVDHIARIMGQKFVNSDYGPGHWANLVNAYNILFKKFNPITENSNAENSNTNKDVNYVKTDNKLVKYLGIAVLVIVITIIFLKIK